MTVRAIFRFENNDSTQDLNLRFKAFLKRGVLEGASLSPVSGQKKIDITPYLAASSDGMIVEESDTVRLDLVAGENNVVAIKAKYVFSDEPILDYEVIESSIFDGLLNREDYIVFGKINLAPSATEATSEDISLLDRDETDEQGRNVIRGKIETAGVPSSIGTSVSIPDDASIFEANTSTKVYNNSVLNPITYNTDAGFVEYDNTNGPVDLSSVSVGDRFRDSNGTFYSVIRVDTSTLRVYIVDSITSELPLKQNRDGDLYVEKGSNGGIVSIYAWNGQFWLNITNTLSLQGELTAHRNNIFPDEYHATEDQEAAMLGSDGSPSFFNRYLTESDPRLPTQDENDALIGLPSNPNSTNKFITENYSLVELSQFSAALPPFTLSLQGLGPYYVGTGPVNSANNLFALADFEENRGYINSSGVAPKIIGLFKDSGLTNPLNPSVDADSQGFFNGTDIYFDIEGVIDIGIRILFSKKTSLTSYDRGMDTRISPADNYVPSEAVMHIQDIKGRPFDELIPLEESNVNLRKSIEGLISYLGSSQKTSIVAAKEDFEFLKEDDNFGPTYTFLNTSLVPFTYDSGNGRVEYSSSDVELSGVELGNRFRDGTGKTYTIVTINANSSPKYVEIVDSRTATIPLSINTTITSPQDGSIFDENSAIFDENEGIPIIFTFENTLLSSITYSNGLVTYLDNSVDLSSVNVGNTFIDGLDNRYEVTSVDNISKTVNIVSFISGKPPAGISTSVGLPDDASIVVTNNPRGVLLNELKIQGGETLPIDDLIKIDNEYSTPEGFICYGIPSEKRVDPRVRLYGGWERVQDDDTGEIVIQNANSIGSIEFTGFVTSVYLLCRIQPGSPDLNVSINNESIVSTISTSHNGDADAGTSNIPGERYHRVLIREGLDSVNPTHISVTFNNTGATPLIIAGLEPSWVGPSNALNWEPGVGFENTELFRKDVITQINNNGLGANSRGGSTIYGGRSGGSQLSVSNSILPDIDTGVQGDVVGNTLNISTNVSKLVSFSPGDLVRLRGSSAVEIARIDSITSPTVVLTTSKTTQPNVKVDHICSTGDQSPLSRERELDRYFILSDFISGASTDFGPANVAQRARRYVAHKDGHTVAAARDSKMLLNKGAVEIAANTGRMHFSVCATRLDLVFNSDTSFNLDISVDGSSFFTINVDSGPVRRTLFYNAKYQQHEVTVKSSSTWAFQQMIIFGPATGNIHPAAPLAQTDLISSFIETSSLDENPFRRSDGIVYFDASKHISFGNGAGANPTWAVEQINSHFGQTYITQNDGDFAEGFFLGTGMELLYIARPDGGKAIWEIDGISVDSITGSTIYGNYSGGFIDTYNVSEVDKVVGIRGLSFGYHRFVVKQDNPREKNIFSTGNKISIIGYNVTNTNSNENLSATFVPKNANRPGRYSRVGDIRDYSTFVQDLLGESAFPIELIEKVDSAFGYTDGSGTPFNLGTSVVSNKTRITLAFTFIPGVNAGTPFGELQVEINGQVIPRFLSGVTTGSYFKELNGNELELDSDYSNYNQSIFIRRISGPAEIDTSLLGTISRQIGFSAIVGTPTDLAASVATHTDLQSAINDVNPGEKIKVLPGTFTGSVAINKRVYIEGSGYDTHIDGDVTFSSSFSYVKEFRFGESLVLDGTSKGNIIAYAWQDPSENLSNTGTSNSISLVKVN